MIKAVILDVDDTLFMTEEACFGLGDGPTATRAEFLYLRKRW